MNDVVTWWVGFQKIPKISNKILVAAKRVEKVDMIYMLWSLHLYYVFKKAPDAKCMTDIMHTFS